MPGSPFHALDAEQALAPIGQLSPIWPARFSIERKFGARKFGARRNSHRSPATQLSIPAANTAAELDLR